MLNTVLLQEAIKANSPRPSSPQSCSKPRRQTISSSPLPSNLKKSILKTPAAKRRTGRGVVFADLDDYETTPKSASPSARKSRSPLRFKCTPMPIGRHVEAMETDENATPNREATLKQRSDFFAVSDSPSNVMKRLSLSDTPPHKNKSVDGKHKSCRRHSQRLH